MVRLMKGSVIMDVSEDVASVFKDNGYMEEVLEPIAPQPVVEDEVGEIKSPDYTKSDILRMKNEALKVLAAQLGLEVTEESIGKVLKEEIVEKLGL